MTPGPEVFIESMAHGGQGVTRMDGKVHFIPDALPGSTVVIEVIEDHPSWSRARVSEVVVPGPYSAAPVCRHAGECGGCQWQHAQLDAQRDWKRRIVIEQLERIGRLPDPPVNLTKATGDPYGYRNRMDYVVHPAGGLALHRRGSDELVGLEECPVIHPSLRPMLEVSDFVGLGQVTLRTGVYTGDRLVVIDGDLPSDAPRWGVPVCRVERHRVVPLLGDPWVHEVVAGIRFRITGSAFFQNNTKGAGVLAEVVAAATGRDGTLVDLYAGGGLFSCTVGRRFDRVVAVESSPLAVGDLLHNSNGLDHVEVHSMDVEKAGGVLARHRDSTVIADPPRIGLGKRGVASILGAHPRRIILVSCDPASLGRDARLLVDGGYRLVEATPLDMFPQTFHVEVVSRFERA